MRNKKRLAQPAEPSEPSATAPSKSAPKQRGHKMQTVETKSVTEPQGGRVTRSAAARLQQLPQQQNEPNETPPQEPVSDFPIRDLATTHPQATKRRAPPEESIPSTPHPAKKKRSPARKRKTPRRDAGTSFLGRIDSQFPQVRPGEQQAYDAAVALTTLRATARQPLTRLEEEPDALGVRSSSIDLVDISNDAPVTRSVDGEDSEMGNNSEDDYLYSEEEIDIDSWQQEPEPVTSQLPKASQPATFEYPNDTFYYADDSFIKAVESPSCHGRTRKRRGKCSQLPNTSSAPGSQPVTRPHSLTLPELSDDDDDVPIDDYLGVHEARSRIAEYDKEKKAEAKKTASKAKGVSKSQNQGEYCALGQCHQTVDESMFAQPLACNLERKPETKNWKCPSNLRLPYSILMLNVRLQKAWWASSLSSPT